MPINMDLNSLGTLLAAQNYAGSPAESFQSNLQGALSSFVAREREKRQREQSFSDAIRLARAKLDLERQYAMPGEWKPTTKEEALEFEKAKYKPYRVTLPDAYGNKRVYELNPETNAFEEIPISAEIGEGAPETSLMGEGAPRALSDWGDVAKIAQLLAVLTPTKTPSERRLGGLRFGGLFRPPPTTNRLAPNIPGGFSRFAPQATNQRLEFNSLEEAEAANLPIGTMIYIQGRRAIVE